MKEEILTVQETADFLRCHASTVYRKLEAGAWPFAWKIGKDWRIEKSKLLAHLTTQPVHSRDGADPMPSIHDRRARFAETMARGRSAA